MTPTPRAAEPLPLDPDPLYVAETAPQARKRGCVPFLVVAVVVLLAGWRR